MSSTNLRLLVIDDDPDDLVLFQGYLSELYPDYDVSAAPQIPAPFPDVDALVIDRQLGSDIAVNLLKASPPPQTLPKILFSDYSLEDIPVEEQAMFDATVQKKDLKGFVAAIELIVGIAQQYHQRGMSAHPSPA